MRPISADRGVHRLAVEHVEHAGRDVGHAVELGELVRIDVGGDDARAGAREGLDRGPADALRRRGDQADLAVETAHE